MKISDFIFQFASGHGVNARGLCRTRIFATRERKVFAVLTDLTSVGFGGTGPSVTNSVERIRVALIDSGFMADETTVIEHYETESLRDATFDIVAFSRNNSPSWKSCTAEAVCTLLGCEISEFETNTKESPRLMSEIEKTRNSLNPFFDSPTIEDHTVVNRRLNIEARMIGKETLAHAVNSGASEGELHRLVSEDLSILAEVYASPSDEYLCFSEFPIGDGFVDFAIFSGRSRMDVTLIEIKGANFDLATTGSYKNFSSKANEAIQQIRTRIGVAYRDMESFRKNVHLLRQRVEAGELIHRSFVGPIARLEVDSNKDINLRGVVIAGRTRNDSEESRQRHDYEWNVIPPIKIETWDTWIRKLRRS